MDGVDGFGEGGVGHRDKRIVAEDAVGRVESAPAGTGEKHFGPSVHGEGQGRRAIGGRGFEKIAADEAGGEAEVATELDEEDGVVATGTGAEGDGFGGGLDAGFVAAVVAEGVFDGAVERGEQGQSLAGRSRQVAGEPGNEERGGGGGRRGEGGGEGESLGRRVVERESGGGGGQEKIEGIGVERFDEEGGVDVVDGGEGGGRVVGPVEGVLRGVAGGDELGGGGEGEGEMVETLAGGLAGAEVERVRGKRHRLRIGVAGEVRGADEHESGEMSEAVGEGCEVDGFFAAQVRSGARITEEEGSGRKSGEGVGEGLRGKRKRTTVAQRVPFKAEFKSERKRVRSASVVAHEHMRR